MMAAITYLSLYFLLVSQVSLAHKFLAGSTSLSNVANDIINNFNDAYNQDVAPYLATASGPAVINFISGEYINVASDVPMTAAQDTATKNIGGPGKKGKITIPLCISTYTFATRKSPNVKLTASQVVGIYKGTTKSWSDIAAGTSGNIVPVARSDLSGVTAVINSWIAGNVPSWAPTGEKTWNGQAGISKTVQFKVGTAGIILALRQNVNAIGYMATGLAVSSSLHQSKIKNKAGVYLLATEADPYQSIPRTLPPSSSSWSAVSLVNKPGNKTYAIVSFEYLIARRDASCLWNLDTCLPSSSLEAILKAFLPYTQSDAVQNLFDNKYKNQFFRLPDAIISKNRAAINSIS